ncbi:Pyrethroid hydrolase Ces2a-like [Homarus americanus]|uniref:Pyrethroid hydrolase Ces2a-like n=1 Tax=Homarus americanus TaxID=6706 RepID=A0A8J5J847_HOMAM|nr:Pyrethroid hydrolase Ces2a-like [Homarus americanus]
MDQNDAEMRTLAAAALVLAAAAASAKAEEDSPVVATEEGLVSGLREESTKGRTFYSYYGIPFAKPPLGNLRLQDPEATKSWEGVLDGSKMPEICLQVPSDAALGGIKVPPEVIVGDEDCLYLNVFTPTAGVDGGRSDLPVMVWLHGGGFVFGSAQEYLPHVLMTHDVVLVVVQYRLGILGEASMCLCHYDVLSP